MKIREIQEKDNPQVKEVIQKVLVEMGVPKVGTAYEDKSLDDMFGTYSSPGMKYFVVEHEGADHRRGGYCASGEGRSGNLRTAEDVFPA